MENQFYCCYCSLQFLPPYYRSLKVRGPVQVLRFFCPAWCQNLLQGFCLLKSSLLSFDTCWCYINETCLMSCQMKKTSNPESWVFTHPTNNKVCLCGICQADLFNSSWVLNSPFPDRLLALGQVEAADISSFRYVYSHRALLLSTLKLRKTMNSFTIWRQTEVFSVF